MKRTAKRIFGLKKDYRSAIDNPEEQEKGIITRPIEVLEKPLEVFYEQIAKRNATGLASVETTEERRKESFDQFYDQLSTLELHPSRTCFVRSGLRYGSNISLTVMLCRL